MPLDVDDTTVSELARLAFRDARERLQWAAGRCRLDRLVVTASFGDTVLAHLAHTTLPGIRIVLLDTGYLFAETQWFAERVAKRFGFNLEVIGPDADAAPDQWQYDTDGCCAARKVRPLQRALADADVWITGLRRGDSASRASTPPAHVDLFNDVIKLNPIADWGDDYVAAYQRRHDLPQNPLTERGYPSIGCWPCTAPVREGDDPRSGRWADSDKTECGLHGLSLAGVGR